MGYCSRRPHQVPLLSAKNRKLRLKFTQGHQNWTIEGWKNVAWSDESPLQLRHSDSRVRIWRKQHEIKYKAPLGCGGTGDSHHRCACTNLQQLHDAVISIWTKISEECFQHLVESMPRRIKTVLKAKGGPTFY